MFYKSKIQNFIKKKSNWNGFHIGVLQRNARLYHGKEARQFI